MDITHWLLEICANVALGLIIALDCWAEYRLRMELKARFAEMKIELDPERPGGSVGFIWRREYRQLRDAKVTQFGDLAYFGGWAAVVLMILMPVFGLRFAGNF